MLLTEHLSVADTTIENNTITTKIRRSYNLTIDAVVAGLKERSEQDDLSLLKSIDRGTFAL